MQKKEEVRAVLTEARIGLRGRAGSVGVDGGRRRRNGHSDKVGAGALRVCRCVEEVRAGAAKG